MRLISIDQLMKKSKAVLIRKITQHLRSMPKKRIAMLYYEMSKFGLIKLRKTTQKALPRRKTKRKKMTKAEKTKFLARINKGRIKAGLKPIRAKS